MTLLLDPWDLNLKTKFFLIYKWNILFLDYSVYFITFFNLLVLRPSTYIYIDEGMDVSLNSLFVEFSLVPVFTYIIIRGVHKLCQPKIRGAKPPLPPSSASVSIQPTPISLNDKISLKTLQYIS